jgi:hypothetical protein
MKVVGKDGFAFFAYALYKELLQTVRIIERASKK